jgi:hypothetical protein
MLRRFAGAAVIVLVVVGFAAAEKYKGFLLSIEDEGKTIKVKIDDKEKTMKVNEKAEFTRKQKDEDKTSTAAEAVKGWAKALERAKDKGGVAVEIETKGEKDNEEVVKVKRVPKDK